MAVGWVHFHKNKLSWLPTVHQEHLDMLPREQLPPSTGTEFLYSSVVLVVAVLV